MDAIARNAARKPSVAILSGLGLALGLAAGAALVPSLLRHAPAEAGYVVSQGGRAFSPGSLTIPQGERLTIVNDDGRNVHHAYVEEAGFRFDSGDQEPGDSTVIAFPAAGAYQVLCGIHPKMRMVVTVR